MKKTCLLFFLAGFYFLLSAEQNYLVLDTLHLVSEKKIYPCKIGYRTLGKINKDSSNVIIFPTWFGGTSSDIENLIIKHNFIDQEKWFIVIIDALGNGISESPSTYSKDYPLITISDMVKSQRLLIKQIFGFNKIYAVIGGSMGGMQVFKWLVTYPQYMQKAIPYVSTPGLTSYDLLYLNTQKDIIDSGKRFGLPEKVINRQLGKVQALLSHTPEYKVEKIPLEEIDKYLKKLDIDEPFFTIENWLSQLNAMYNYTITDGNETVEMAAEKIKADVFVIVSSSDHIVNPIPAIELAKKKDWKLLILENNCGHLAIGCEMERCVSQIARFLNK